MVEKETQAVVDDIEWIPQRFDGEINEETTWEKLVRKTKDNPAVPLGLAATIGALSYGLVSFYQDRKMMQQKMMRARVAFQGFTLLAIVYSIYKESQKLKKKEES